MEETLTDTEDRYFDLPRLSEYSCLGVGTIRDYIRCGLPCFKLKGKVLVKRTEFDTWIEQFRYGNKSVEDIANEVIESLKSDI
jgi:hypothetical protein